MELHAYFESMPKADVDEWNEELALRGELLHAEEGKYVYFLDHNGEPLGRLSHLSFGKCKGSMMCEFAIFDKYRDKGVGKLSMGLFLNSLCESDLPLVLDVYEDNKPAIRIYEFYGLKVQSFDKNLARYALKEFKVK